MKTLYLHIGMPKTGTTYMQNFLSKNNDVLKKQGFIYPDFGIRFKNIGGNRNGHFLVSVIRDEEGNRSKEKEREVENECYAKIFALFEKYSNVILSEEQIWSLAEGRRNRKFWDNLLHRLEEKNIHLKLVVYLRRQDLFIQSSWAQQVKDRDLYISLQEYIESKGFTKKKLDYYERLNVIAEHVGKENIIIRVYEKSQYKGKKQTIISDFFHVLGIDYTEEFEDFVKHTNSSLSGIYLETKRELNKIEGLNQTKSFVSDLLKKVAENNDDVKSISSNEFWTYEENAAFYNRYARSNEAVAREYLGREDGKLFVEDFVKNDASRKPYEVSDYVEVLAQMLLLQNERIEKLRGDIRDLKTLKKGVAFLPQRAARKIKRAFSK